jgi:hypothetical protein
VAFDARSVCAARSALGVRGWSLAAFTREPLEPGTLVPSASDSNIARPAEMLAALNRVRRRLAETNQKVVVVLPDGIARVACVNASRWASADYHRFCIAPGLPYPANEAIVDQLRLKGGLSVIGAVRRGVVQGYEAILEEVDWAPKRVDLAVFAALESLQRKPPCLGVAVDLILADTAYSLLAWSGGMMRIFRQRRRDRSPGEPQRLWNEVDRTSALLAKAETPVVRIVGPGAHELRAHAASIGRPVTLAWELHQDGLEMEGAELSWLGATLR